MPSLHLINADNTYVRLPDMLYKHVAPVPSPEPVLLLWNDALSQTLGLQTAGLSDDDKAAFTTGNMLPHGAECIAQAYAGHQFGHFNMLGDGRAHVLAEHITPAGTRVDIQLKGSGRTPFSRRGDGRAAMAPMLREYIISEAMHALHIPTTRALAVAGTGERVQRQTAEDGAVLARVAASHIRVGTFAYVAAQGDAETLCSLADYTIARHYPDIVQSEQPYIAFLDAVIDRQSALVAGWLGIGFIHGVMNTDNVALSGETIDYGPCAFMDAYDPATVFSSIDTQGRYAFGNQPHIMQWNMARFAESLLPLLHDDMKEAIAIAEARIERAGAIFQQKWLAVMRRKLGFSGEEQGDEALIGTLLQWMQRTNADYTNTFRTLSDGTLPASMLELADWHAACTVRRADDSVAMMRANNPAVIPRNHKVEAALDAARAGDIQQIERLNRILSRPFDDVPEGDMDYTLPPKDGGAGYKTFCGT